MSKNVHLWCRVPTVGRKVKDIREISTAGGGADFVSMKLHLELADCAEVRKWQWIFASGSHCKNSVYV